MLRRYTDSYRQNLANVEKHGGSFWFVINE